MLYCRLADAMRNDIVDSLQIYGTRTDTPKQNDHDQTVAFLPLSLIPVLDGGLRVLALTAIACGGGAPAAQTEPVTVEVTRIVEQTGPEVTREVQVEVTREVPVEVTRVVTESSPADDPGKLIIHSGRSESLVAPIIQQFKGATGIDVQVKYAGTAALAATLLEEGENSPADVFYAQDPGGLAAVSEMMADLPTDIIELTPQWARSGEGRWVGITGRARVIVYGTDSLTEADLPDDLWGFTEPEWKGRVGWAPTNGSFQAMVTALRMGWGEDRAEEWLRAMPRQRRQDLPPEHPTGGGSGGR